VIAEVLVLIRLVNRVFLVARDPLSLDRRQWEKSGLLRPRQLWKTYDYGQSSQNQSSASTPQVCSHSLPRSVAVLSVRLRISLGGDNPISSSDHWFDRVTPCDYFSETGKNG
jgi:hypothetical protein